ncbi:unnamed protein product [Orchesella dallaii]|uniref:Uncharacterized protein n=1 Tax=Orchesella dallaii TaxID=48710 RepID=A0ABP1S0C7_9HEXA
MTQQRTPWEKSDSPNPWRTTILSLLIIEERCQSSWSSVIARLGKKAINALATGGVFAGIDHALVKAPVHTPGSGVIQIYTGKVQGEAQVEGNNDTDTVTIVVAGSAAVIILVIIGFCISLVYLRKTFAVNRSGNDIELQEVNV